MIKSRGLIAYLATANYCGAASHYHMANRTYCPPGPSYRQWQLSGTLRHQCRITAHINRRVKKVKQSHYRPGVARPEGSRKLRFPDYMTTTQDGG